MIAMPVDGRKLMFTSPESPLGLNLTGGQVEMAHKIESITHVF